MIRRKGFTLIELLVVMFIIGLLASLVVVNVNSSRTTARDAKRVANMKTIQGALEQYNEKNGEYPRTFVLSNSTNISSVTPQHSTVNGTFIDNYQWVGCTDDPVLPTTAVNITPTGLSDPPSGSQYYCLRRYMGSMAYTQCYDGFCGDTLIYGKFNSMNTGPLDTRDLIGWIPNLAPTYMQTLPSDPKYPTASGGQSILYKSDGKNYKILANNIMETIDVSTACSAPASLQDIRDWRCTAGVSGTRQQSVSLISSGDAYNW